MKNDVVAALAVTGLLTLGSQSALAQTRGFRNLGSGAGSPGIASTAELVRGAVAQDLPEPPALELTVGSRMRVQTRVSSGGWVEGILVRADAESLSFVPEGAPPLGDNQLAVPTAAVTRLEISTGKKRQWLKGLLIGAGLGVGLGATAGVDSGNCGVDSDDFCSRGEALAIMTLGSAGIGALLGSLVKKDRWLPVALDTLGPPPEKAARATVGLRPVPGGVAAALSVQF